MTKKRIRLCVIAILGVAAIGFAVIVRSRILAWPKLHEDDIFGPPDSIAVILKEMWGEPVDPGGYRVYDGGDTGLDIHSDRPFIPEAWLVSRTPRAAVEIGPDWMLKGQQKDVPTPGRNQKRYIAGAIHAVTKRMAWVTGERKTSALFITLLWQLASRYNGACGFPGPKRSHASPILRPSPRPP